jgi:TsgA-like MFS transporter
VTSSERLFAVSCTGMFVFGMILGLPGTVLGQATTVEQFGLTLADRGVLIATLYAGLLGGSLISGALVDSLGPRFAIACSSLLVGGGFPVFALAQDAALAMSSLCAIGLASATLNTASNALASQLFPDQRGRRMNLIAVVVSLGGLAMPIATAIASTRLSWRGVVFAGAALSIGVALLALRVPVVGRVAAGRASPIRVLRELSVQPGFAWFLLLVMLAGGNEASMAGWTSSVVTASGFSSSMATWILSSHWLGLMLARLVLSTRVDEAKDTAIERSAVLSVLLLVMFITASSRVFVWIGPFAIGCSMALVMPTLLALAGERLRANAGALFGGLLTVAQIGGIVLPWAIGLLAEQVGVRTALSVLVVSYGVIALLVRRLPSPVTDDYQPSGKPDRIPNQPRGSAP